MLGLATLSVSGCHHRDQVRQGKAQELEIKQLEAELAKLDEARKPYATDRSAELAKNKERLEREQMALAYITPQVAAAETRKDDLEKKLATYKAEHPVK